jgi:hypothetical protein
MGVTHWIAHRLGWHWCRHDYAHLDGADWCFVSCVTCGAVSFAFPMADLRIRDDARECVTQ